MSPRLIAGEHGLVLLHPLLLRPDHQEVEQDDQADQRQELEQQVLRSAQPAGAGGSERRQGWRTWPLRNAVQRAASRRPRSKSAEAMRSPCFAMERPAARTNASVRPCSAERPTPLLARIAEALERLAPPAAARAGLRRRAGCSGTIRRGRFHRRAGLSAAARPLVGVDRQKARFVENLRPLRPRPAVQPRPALGRARHRQELARQGGLHGRGGEAAGAASWSRWTATRSPPCPPCSTCCAAARALRGAVRRPLLRGGRGRGQGAEVGAGGRRLRARRPMCCSWPPRTAAT